MFLQPIRETATPTWNWCRISLASSRSSAGWILTMLLTAPYVQSYNFMCSQLRSTFVAKMCLRTLSLLLQFISCTYSFSLSAPLNFVLVPGPTAAGSSVASHARSNSVCALMALLLAPYPILLRLS